MPAFDVKHQDDLKAWLTKELEPICDADPEVLADYVMALLKHEGSEAELQSSLSEQLEDFLAEQTSAFVSKALGVLKTQDFLPASKRPSTSAQGGDLLGGDAPSSSRKRAADDEGRRSPPKAARDVEARNRAERGRHQDDRGSRRDGQQRQRPQCRDFHQRGFCARGDVCKFDHTLAGGPPGGPPQNAMMGQGMPQPPFGMPGNQFGGPQFSMPQGGPPFNGQGHPPYSPHMPGGMMNSQMQNGESSGLAARLGGQMSPQQPDMTAVQPVADFSGMNGGGARGGRGGARGGRGGARGTFEKRPTSNTTLVIENVPQENLDLIQVNEYFKKFGTITNIQIDAPSQKALVSFSQPAEAKAAHTSPEVIFNNRFVKVYFQKLDEPLSKPAPAAPPAAAQALRPTAQPFKSNFVPGQNKFVRPELAQEKAKDAQAAVDAAQKKLDGFMAEQKELMTKLTGGSVDAEEKKTLMARFPTLETDIKKATEEVRAAVTASKEGAKAATPSSTPASSDPAAWHEQRAKQEREQLDRELEAHSKGGETSDELRAKLAKLEAEAGELGINAAEVMAGSTRGSFRGGARGARGFRGSTRGGFNSYYRGRGGMSAPSRGSMSLDNRTAKLHVTDVPQGGADKAKEYFKQFGDLDDITDREDGTFVVAYKARASGEKALRSGLSVPDVGAVKATWSSEGVSAPAASAPATVEDGDGGDEQDGAGEEEGDDSDDHFRRG